jgi:gas vesicle protein
MANYNNEGAAFFAGLVIGGLVGAALALLLAPQSGEETRAQIRDKSLEYKDLAEERILEARQRATEAGHRAQEQISTLQEKSKEALVKGKETATGAIEKGKQTVNQAVRRTKDGSATELGSESSTA